jgi:hypothetical protein
MKYVYLVWHSHDLGGVETDDKLIGVYATRQSAALAVRRLRRRPGFRRTPRGFGIDRYLIGEDQWVEGFTTVRRVGTREVFGPD